MVLFTTVKNKKKVERTQTSLCGWTDKYRYSCVVTVTQPKGGADSGHGLGDLKAWC